MTAATLKWGVLGTANIGRAVNPAIHASHNGALVAVASRDAGKARAYAEQWSIPRYHASYLDLLADPEIDAVYIPLPNGLHKEWTIRAAEHGKHILCEKPLALTADECRTMYGAAESNGVTLMEAFMYRFHPRTERVIALVQGGALGTVRAIRSAFTFRLTQSTNVRFDATLGGGALFDVGCYCVSVTRTIAQAEPVEVQAWATYTDRDVDEQLAGSMRFANGLVAHFDCALNQEQRQFYDIGGTDASINVEWAFNPGSRDLSLLQRGVNREERREEFAGIDQYRLMVEHFADCALHNRPVRYDAREAAANMTVIEALYRSARNGGRTVRM